MSSMSISNKKKLILNTVAVDLGCGSCRKSNITNLFNPKPKHKNRHTRDKRHSNVATLSNSSTTSTSSSKYDTASAASFSASTVNTPPHFSSDTDENNNDGESHCLRSVRGFGRVGGESLAVEKDSDDPYLDFRYSMLQMILEKEIYSKEELKELLNVFLQLNSPYYHGVIVRAFTEIWNGVFSVRNNNGYVNGSPKLHCGFKSRDL